MVRIRLRFSWQSGSSIPIHYSPLVQAAIYRTLEPSLASFIHDHGIRHSARQFRFFTFSRILGPYKLSADRQWINFPGDSELVISSPIDILLHSLARGFLDRAIVQIGTSSAVISAIESERVPLLSDSTIRIRTLSPIVAYNTMLRMDKRKYTLYREPSDPEFSRLVFENLRHKMAGLREWMGQAMPSVSESPVRVRTHHARLRILKYRDIVVKGYDGVFTVTGDPALLHLGLESGFGSKNSQGFGCVEQAERPSGLKREGYSNALRHAPTGAGLS
ncbi:MAG: CRISPR-associated endoribonuclease Cas6 [Sulfobacillus sp.]